MKAGLGRDLYTEGFTEQEWGPFALQTSNIRKMRLVLADLRRDCKAFGIPYPQVFRVSGQFPTFTLHKGPRLQEFYERLSQKPPLPLNPEVYVGQRWQALDSRRSTIFTVLRVTDTHVKGSHGCSVSLSRLLTRYKVITS